MESASRFKRVLIVAGLGVIGLGVIALLGRGDDRLRDRDGNRPVGVVDAPDGLPTDIKPNTGIDIIQDGGPGQVQITDPTTGRLKQEIQWAGLDPQEQGVFDVDEPRIRLFLEKFRVIQIEADKGKLVMPNRNLEAGEFVGNLIITVFECEPDEKLNLSAKSPDRALKLKLDRATFDATLGEVRSDSKVELMTPATRQAYFRGKGLTLVYNEVASRVDYLEITKGDMLRYAPEAQSPSGDPVPDKPKDIKPDEREGTDQPAEPKTEPETESPKEPRASQFYHLVFNRQVRAVSEGRVIEADLLDVYFAVRKPDDPNAAEEPSKPSARATTPAMATLPMIAPRTPNVWPIALGQIGEPKRVRISNDPDAPYPGVDDLVLTWSGKMVMKPTLTPPDSLADGDEPYFKFTGSPTTVTLNERDKLTCHSIAYLDSTKTATALGSPAFPLRIESPVLGVVSAPKLIANVEKNNGQLVGAGSIRAPQKQPDDGADRLPSGFKIDWSQRVDLAFATPEKKPTDGEDVEARDAASQVVAGIESAVFIGDVVIEDRQMKMTAQQLNAGFEVTPGGGDRQLSRIDAAGGVKVTFDDARIEAKELRVATAPNKAGRLTPVRLVADGRVVVIDPTQQMTADALDVTLVERPKAPKAGATKDPKKLSLNERMSVEPDKIVAKGNVELRMLGKDTRVYGDTLNADAAKGTAVLLGDPVRILRGGDEAKGIKPQAELIVPKLNLQRDGRIALAEGKGVFVWTQVDADAIPPKKAGNPGDKPAAPDVEKHKRRVKVTWTERMRYDDSADLIQVFGKVVAEAEDAPDELNRLTASQMTLELVDPRKLAAAIELDPIDAGAAPIDAGLDRRQLKRLTAREDVVLLATKWTDATRQKIQTRVRMAGPLLVFNNISEQAQIIGPGSMLIEDRRPTDREPTKTRATPISGRGASAFTWSQRLLLDNIATDMTLEGDVQLTHQPADGKAIVELKTQRLLADMESATAIRALGLTRSDAMVIRKVDANGAVQVRDHGSNRLVTSDRLIYDGITETILLTADEGRKVNVIQLDKPKPVRAANIFWDLKNDTVEIRDAGF